MKKLLTVCVVLLLVTQIFSQTRDYKTLQNMLIKFYGYQRAGLKDATCYNLNANFQNASHNNDNYNGHMLDGGWYDAGDYIKFGVNLGYSVYCLLKGYDAFPTGYDNNSDWTYKGTDNIPDILNEVKVATDYLIKAVIDENNIVLDVGNGQAEHDRDGFTIPNISGRSGTEIHFCNGADVPATYAACLALMSTLYRQYSPSYADSCLDKAKVAFAFAKKKVAAGGDANLFCTPQSSNTGKFYDYPSTNGVYTIARRVEDKTVAAGVELYRATVAKGQVPDVVDPTYKKWAQTSIPDQYNCMGYAYIGPLAAFEVWRQGLSSGAGVLNTNLGFCSGKIQTTGPFAKVFQNTDWGTARDVGTVAMEYALGYCTIADDTKRETYKQNVINHVDWVAGNIGVRSYICGVNGGPTRIHYRTSSYQPIPGAVVTGPNSAGVWNDDGTANYTEVAIDYNAGIIGAIAFLRAVNSPSDTTTIHVTSSFSASKKDLVDFNKESVTLKATLSKSAPWTITLTGANGSKTFTGSGTSISAVWDGTADKGTFLSGEAVSATCSVNGTIAIFDMLKISPITINISQVKKPAAKTDDISIDDFEDKNLVNKINGNWVAIGSKTGPIAGTTTSFTADSGSQVLVISGSVSTTDNKNYTGVKSTFNSAATPIDISSVKSFLFDLMGSKMVNVYVELEQPSITDGAYWSTVVPVSAVMNRYRVNIADFKQPDWKTTEKPLDLKNITALRFTVYDSIGSVKLYLDNVAIEIPLIGVKNIGSKLIGSSYFKPVISNRTLMYSIPTASRDNLLVSIYNVAGKMVLKQTQSMTAGKIASISLSSLPSGMYTVVNTVNGNVVGDKLKFMYTK